MTSLFPWSTPELEEIQHLFLSYINDSYDDCTCGCKGFPINILTVEFEEQDLDLQAYKDCPARNRRSASEQWKNFKTDEVYQQFLIDIYPIRYGPRLIAAAEKRERERERVEKTEQKQMSFVVARMKAKELGRKTYQGNRCVNGHNGERNVKSNDCVSCREIHRSVRDAIKRGAFRESLTKAEKSAVAEMYKNSRRLTVDTGVQHHVDHIKPLAAGGRHRASNLQILTASENLSKGSKYNSRQHRFSNSEKKRAATDKEQKRAPSNVKVEAAKQNKGKGFWAGLFS
jgi:5-methylcytosine-specific restriction endonuclease McrA